MPKPKRTMYRWLTEKLYMCHERSLALSRYEPEKAWERATPNERYMVMREVGIKHTNETCPYCNDDAKANKALPTRVLNAFRKWQRSKS